MLTEDGGVIDDLIVYYMTEDFFRTVVNAATRDKDLPWIEKQAAAFGVTVAERRDLAMVAVQGPNARAKVIELLSPESAIKAAKLGKFVAAELDDMFVARTGYTGEDGFEIMVPETLAVDFWNRLLAVGIKPAGLGARDTLRLEAGMALYGQDMDESVSPLEAGLAWTVAFDEGREFIGRAALEKQVAAGVPRQTVGLVMDEKGVLRHGQDVFTAAGQGEILSGTFSPTLGKAIALARVPAGETGSVEVDIRGKRLPVRAVRYPFVRDGAAQAGV
jgi:aminomethyltransferase